MANLRYFIDRSNGETVQVSKVQNRNQSHKHDDCWGWTGEKWEKITRVINRKSSPSMHECDARCMYATGRTMQCECSCGGKNHGKGKRTIECVAA